MYKYHDFTSMMQSFVSSTYVFWQAVAYLGGITAALRMFKSCCACEECISLGVLVGFTTAHFQSAPV